MNVFHHLQKDKQRKQRHLLKLGKKRRESSKRNYCIVSPRVIMKAIIIITKEMCSTRIVQHGWNGGCSGKCLPNRWQLMTLCFCRNEKNMQKDIASVLLPCTPAYAHKFTHAHAHKFLATTTHTWTNTYTPTHANTHVHFSINSLVNAYIGDGWKH